jgi:hypothetical protein
LLFGKGIHRIVVAVFLASISSLILITSEVNVGLSTPVAEDAEFLNDFYALVNDTNQMTQNYNEEVGKWKKGDYDNQQIVQITDSYLPQYDQLIAKASSLSTPEKFQNALDLYIKSLNSERESNALFGEFIKTGDSSLNDTSTNLLSDAYKYESDSFALIRAENNTSS